MDAPPAAEWLVEVVELADEVGVGVAILHQEPAQPLGAGDGDELAGQARCVRRANEGGQVQGVRHVKPQDMEKIQLLHCHRRGASRVIHDNTPGAR